MLKKILISIKFILINLGNGFIHQTVLVVSPWAWEDKYPFCPRFCQKTLMIFGQQYQNISCRYCNMRQYLNPAVTIRNRLATLTEQFVAVVGCFSVNER